MGDVQAIQQRIDELEAANAAAPGWGAAVGARQEEINDLRRQLRRAASPPVASPPASVEEIAREIAEGIIPNMALAGSATEFERALMLKVRDAFTEELRALLSDRAAMAERVERLERERDAARESEEQATDCFREANQDLAASEAEVARLREALEAVRDMYEPEVWEYIGDPAIVKVRAALTRPDEPTKET